MNILKILFLIPLSILSLKMAAQVDDLLKNKDITWVAETDNDFLVDEAVNIHGEERLNYATSLKYINQQNAINEEKFALYEWLFSAFESGELPIFKDALCTKRYTSKVLWGADSVTFIDPKTDKNRVEVVINKPNFNHNITLLRAKQIVYYNAKKAQFGMRTLAMAPIHVYKVYDDNRQSTTYHLPLFWFKAKDLNKIQRLSKKNITWAKRIGFLKGLSVNSDSIKILKNTQGTTPMNHLLTTFETNPKISFYRQEKSNPTRKIDFSERKTLFISRDTIVHWKDNDPKPEFEIINNDLTASDLLRLQLLQNWYWNNRKKRLEIRLIAAAPMKEIYFWTDFAYSLPMFYRRTDD
jgi:Gliding motility associated protein GldN